MKVNFEISCYKFYLSFLFNLLAPFRLEPNMVYLALWKQKCISICWPWWKQNSISKDFKLLDLDKNTYLMLHAKYKDKLNISTEYYTL